MRLILFAVLLVAGCAPKPAGLDSSPEPPPPPRWPSRAFALTTLRLPAPPAPTRKPRVYLDAGHGAHGNGGAVLVTCEREEQFALRATQDLFARLSALGRFELRLSRDGSKGVPYAERLREATAWGAEAFVSVHADARGYARWERTTADGLPCLRNDEQAGFAVLWSDATKVPALAERRLRLAREVAGRMSEAGFLAYDGDDYGGLYEGDAQPGVFVDRHVPGRRIMFLRKPTMPSIIIETHHGLHREEHERWNEEATKAAFAGAVAAALSKFFAGD